MTLSWLQRVKASMLVAVILSGGGGLPLPDVLLCHGRAQLDGPHFETAGQPHSHGDVCRLGSSLPYSPEAAALDVGPAIMAVCFRVDAALPAAVPRSSDLGLFPQPRAPPGLSA